MKKIFILALTIVMAGTMAACGAGDVGRTSSASTSSQAASSSAVSSQAPSADASSYDDSLDGLEKYLTVSGLISGNPSDMQASFIGAEKGARYQFGLNGKDNVSVELYEFNTNSLNSDAQKVLNDVKANGSFTIMNKKVDAIISDSGKYIMIYKDTVTNDENKQRQEKTIKLFKEFKK